METSVGDNLSDDSISVHNSSCHEIPGLLEAVESESFTLDYTDVPQDTCTIDVDGQNLSYEQNSDNTDRWKWFGYEIPKFEIIFFCQICLIYIVVISCIVNLSISNEHSNLWTALLSSSMGILLPSPAFERNRRYPALLNR